MLNNIIGYEPMYILTNSMEPSPSGEASNGSDTQHFAEPES
jgi:hypothetical protein